VVVTERTDRFRFKDRWVDLPVAGVFELRDGKIALWRDYFDLQTALGATQPS
jgi:limonene-1,2-epoxide hydrolase